MADKTGLPGPQWFVDPRNPALWRWWDGIQWTDHCAPREAARATQARASPTAKRMSFFKHEKTTPTVVLVAFRQLGRSDALDSFTRAGAYAYAWNLNEQPQIGQWIIGAGP